MVIRRVGMVMVHLLGCLLMSIRSETSLALTLSWKTKTQLSYTSVATCFENDYPGLQYFHLPSFQLKSIEFSGDILMSIGAFMALSVGFGLVSVDKFSLLPVAFSLHLT